MTWIFFDEISTSPPAVQASMLTFVQNRIVAGIDLTGKCRIVGAANRADTAADGGTLAPALAARWAHFDWVPDFGSWANGQISGWGRACGSYSAEIVGFLQKSNNFFAPQAPTDGNPWPNPRSWSAAARLLLAGGQDIACLVGAAAAAAFVAWRAEMDLPDPAELAAGRAKLPERGDRAYAALVSMVAWALPRTPDDVLDAWRVIGTARPDVSVAAARALLEGRPDVRSPVAVALGEKLLAI